MEMPCLFVLCAKGSYSGWLYCLTADLCSHKGVAVYACLILTVSTYLPTYEYKRMSTFLYTLMLFLNNNSENRWKSLKVFVWVKSDWSRGLIRKLVG